MMSDARSDSGSAELLARLRDYLVMNMHSGSDLGPKFIREIDEALRGSAQTPEKSTMIDLNASELNRLYEGSKDDHYIVVGSEIRQMIGMIRRRDERIAGLEADPLHGHAYEWQVPEVTQALMLLLAAAKLMPRATPKPGGASTVHSYEIEAAYTWALDQACKAAERVLSSVPSTSHSRPGLSEAQRKLDASVTPEQARENVARERKAMDDRKRYEQMTTAEKCAAQGDGFINDYD